LPQFNHALVLGNEGRTIRLKGRVLFCCIKKAVMKTILIVEDEPEACEGLGAILRHEGYEVVFATNGEKALEALRGQRPDLILLDMLMPILDGWQFLKRVTAEIPSPAIPILVVTGTILTREWAKDHGCCGCIRKPIDLDQMMAEIRWRMEEAKPDR
jgi:CheY-like chemotaxis protein